MKTLENMNGTTNKFKMYSLYLLATIGAFALAYMTWVTIYKFDSTF